MKLAFITPAHGPHAPLLDLACAHLDRFAPDIRHIVVVSRNERQLFRHLASPWRDILYKEDILPNLWGRTHLRFRQREIFFHKKRLVGGWIVQQLIKLSAPQFCDADAFVVLDSDVFLLRPLLADAFVSDGRVRLLRNEIAKPTQDQIAWHRSASDILGLRANATPSHDYVGPLASWRRDTCLALREYLEIRWQQPMTNLLARQKQLSEYTLYGLYADDVSDQQGSHFHTSDDLCLSSWSFDPHADLAAAMARALRPNHIAVNLQSNLRWPQDRYTATLASIQAQISRMD